MMQMLVFNIMLLLIYNEKLFTSYNPWFGSNQLFDQITDMLLVSHRKPQDVAGVESTETYYMRHVYFSHQIQPRQIGVSSIFQSLTKPVLRSMW